MKRKGMLLSERRKSGCKEHSCSGGRSTGTPFCTKHAQKKNRHHNKKLAEVLTDKE